MKKVKKFIVSIILAILIIPVTIAAILLTIWVWGRVQDRQIKNEIFTYVTQYKDTITLEDPDKYQEFFYTATGLQDGGVEYGYYYKPDDDYILAKEPYRTGYRTNGIPDDPFDWYYEERICENWFYYEIHDG